MDNFSKRFGGWLRQIRESRQITQTQLGQRAGMTHAQLSHIENQKSAITFLSLIRILRALDVPFTKLIGLGFVSDEYLTPQAYFRENVNSEFHVLTSLDIDTFIRLYYISQGHSLALLVKLYENFISLCQNISIQEAHEISVKTFLSLKQNLHLKYPLEISIPTLQDIFASGGVIIPLDLGAYMHQTRATRGLTLKDVSSRLSISYTSVRNFEQNLSYRAKFSDILDIDKSFGLKGEIIAFGWRTFEFYADIAEMIQRRAKTNQTPDGWYREQLEYIEYLVIISRLYQCHFPENENWLSNFHFLVKGEFSLYEPFELPR